MSANGEQIEVLRGPRGHPVGRQGSPTSEEEPSSGIEGEEQARNLDLKGGQRTGRTAWS